MPAKRQLSRGFGPRGPRRLTTWILGPGGDDLPTLDAISFSANTIAILGSGITPVIPALTIVRIHGHLELLFSAADVALAGFNWVAGIGVVTLDAFTAGAGSIPDLFADIDWPGWMWMATGSIHTAKGAFAVGDPTVNPVIVKIDSKSMRKLRVNEVMFMAFETGEAPAATMTVRGMTRALVKLP